MKRFNRTERVIGTTCVYWLQGRCNRNPCRFLHSETPSILSTASCRDDTASYHNARKRFHIPSESAKTVVRRKTGNDMFPPKHTTKKVLNRNMGDDRERTQVLPQKPSISICKYWMNDNCVHGDQCRNLHSWSYGDGFATLAKLQGHKKVLGLYRPSLKFLIKPRNLGFFLN